MSWNLQKLAFVSLACALTFVFLVVAFESATGNAGIPPVATQQAVQSGAPGCTGRMVQFTLAGKTYTRQLMAADRPAEELGFDGGAIWKIAPVARLSGFRFSQLGESAMFYIVEDETAQFYVVEIGVFSTNPALAPDEKFYPLIGQHLC